MTVAPRVASNALRRGFDLLLFPLVLLERASGRQRAFVLFVYAIVGGGFGLFLWRALSLRNLPDIGEPFDTEAFYKNDVPDSENALVLIDQAHTKLKWPSPEKLKNAFPNRWELGSWSTATAGARSCLEMNRDVLEIWRRATDLKRAFPAKRNGAFGMLYQSLEPFAPLARLEASRLVESGDVEGAWRWYRAALRASRHSLAGGMGSRNSTGRLLMGIERDLVLWLRHPRTDAILVRRALDDVLALKEIDAPPINDIKSAYLAWMKEMNDAPADHWLRQYRDEEKGLLAHLLHKPEWLWFMKREPERTRRVVKIVFANCLAHRELDPDSPADAQVNALAFWPLPSNAPEKARALSTEEFIHWANSSMIIRQFPFASLSAVDSSFRFDQVRRDSLILLLASRLFEIDRGRPPTAPSELIGTVLKQLPEYFDDRILKPAPKPKHLKRRTRF